MPDDLRPNHPEHPPEDASKDASGDVHNDADASVENPDAPASVVFMEMMRQAAARAVEEEEKTHAREKAIEAVRAARREEIIRKRIDEERTRREEIAASKQLPHALPLTDEERRMAAKLEQQRVKRVARRQRERTRRRVSVLGGIVRSFLVVVVAATLMATILSWFTDANFLRPDMRRDLLVAMGGGEPTLIPTFAPTPNYMKRIGIVAGHSGPGQFANYDPGAVCPDGLTELEITVDVAQRVVQQLRANGYTVDLLNEFDPRLDNYEAEVLVSIHANDCGDYGEYVSGFLVAKAAAKPEVGRDTQLAECIAARYSLITGLERRLGTTVDMTDYHSFREINPLTPAAIIELGFMLADREIMTNQSDLVAQGVAEGIRCFMEPFNVLQNLDDPAAQSAAQDAARGAQNAIPDPAQNAAQNAAQTTPIPVPTLEPTPER